MGPKPPQYNLPPPDPLLAQLSSQAGADNLAAMQLQAKQDTASVMARYGTRLALTPGSGLVSSPLAAKMA